MASTEPGPSRKSRQQLKGCRRSSTERVRDQSMDSQTWAVAGGLPPAAGFLLCDPQAPEGRPTSSKFPLLYKVYIFNFFIHMYTQSHLNSTYGLETKSKPTQQTAAPVLQTPAGQQG